MKYEYTLHAREKLKRLEIKKLGIKKSDVEAVIEKPIALDNSEKLVIIGIGYLTKALSLCVAYRIIKNKIRIITFYPAEKGRYERKIL